MQDIVTDENQKMLEVGTKAPDFELPDQNGELHKLSEYLGKKVILYFYLIQSARLLKLMMSGRKRKTKEKYPWVWSEQHILLTNME